MFASGLIVFRETLEAAIIVAIILAATRTIAGRAQWVALGIGGGVVAAAILALLAKTIANLADGVGQELMNAAIMFSAVGLLTWHVVWMSKHGKELAGQMRAVGESVSSGQKHMSVLAIVIGLAIMREGAEVALMLQGLVLGNAAAGGLVIGSIFGLMAGILLGWAMYAGFLRLPVNKLFAITNVLLVLIAAGLAARGVNYLLQAGYASDLGDQVWDTSGFIADHSMLGQFLGVLVGYIAQPNEAQVVAYLATIVLIAVLLALQSSTLAWRRAAMAGLATLVLAGTLFAIRPAHAAPNMKYPYVEQGEVEFEYKGSYEHDNEPEDDGKHEHEFAVGYGVTEFWFTEFEAEFEKEGSEAIKNTALKSENVFQLTERGEYWLDAALYLEGAIGRNDEPDSVAGGFIFGKDIGQTSHYANLFLEGELGEDAEPSTIVQYRWQSRYRLSPWIQPGIELFGDTKGRESLRDQELSVGPGLFGEIPVPGLHHGIGYEIGYQVGTTHATADGALRWKLEYEFFF